MIDEIQSIEQAEKAAVLQVRMEEGYLHKMAIEHKKNEAQNE